MAQRFISSTDVKERVGLSKTEIYRRIAAGTFPQPVPLGEHRMAFLESEVEGWISARVAARASNEEAIARLQRTADFRALVGKRKSRRK